jgi:hypothetical protein
MLVRDSTWTAIREQFSETEKAELRKAVTGETICPRGFSLEVTNLPAALAEKLGAAIKGAR